MARFKISYVSDCIKDVMNLLVFVPQEKHVRCADSPAYQFGSFRKEYPLLLLLHDEASSPAELASMVGVERLAQECGIVVAMPEGGLSFFTDCTTRDSCINDGNESGNAAIEANFSELCYGSAIMETLGYLRAAFPVTSDASNTYIGGIGMGAFGALKLVLQQPSTFNAAFSLSGYTDLQWMMDYSAGREAQFQSIFGGRLARGFDDLPAGYRALAKATDPPRLLQIWEKSSPQSQMNQTLFHALQGNYPGYRGHCSTGTQGWGQVQQSLHTAFHWLQKSI